MQKRGELGAQQLKEIGGLNTQIAGIGVDRATLVAQLANALRGQSLAESQFEFDQSIANRGLDLQRQLADRDYQLRLQLAQMGIG